ncbi:hypothetical protein CRV04_00165 [Candidatus Marinarcus aquaticus]|uniref:Uncharacterized protein n=2 Tax=Candidatus Marinarcus aquaticus TaxID=2044504 RepID=A0A4Q0XVA4_9BACT|nr:hypothetical protein CRV04_00165 [Candidatus Marinarcus aquaticus]
MHSSLYAHSLLMNIFDNEDNTITVMAEFSTGEKAAGALIRLESLVTGEVLYQKRLPLESELTIIIPKEEYQVVLDAGPGHTIVKEGIAPLEGFLKKVKAKNTAKLSQAQKTNNQWSALTTLFFVICIILFLMTIYWSNRNTNRILKQLKAEI